MYLDGALAGGEEAVNGANRLSIAQPNGECARAQWLRP